MANIVKEKGLFTIIKGYTPCADWMIQEYNLYVALVFGRIYRYGKCQATIKTIANSIGVSEKTVERSIKKLEGEKLIIDYSPTLVNRPHTYTVNKKETIHKYNKWKSKKTIVEKDNFITADQIKKLKVDIFKEDGDDNNI